MNIDIRTLAFIMGIAAVIQVIALYLQYLLNITYRGIGWWLLWGASTAAGFLCMLLRDVVPVGLVSVSIFFTNVLLLAGQIFLYTGIMRFLDKKENRGIVIAVFSGFILSTVYVLYVNKDDNARTLIFYAAAAIFLLLAAQGLFVNKTRSFSVSANFICAVLFTQGCYFALRSVAAATIAPMDSVFTPTLIQTASFLVSIIAGSLCTFGLIIMVSQRLNADNQKDEEALRGSEEKFSKAFKLNPAPMAISTLADGRYIDVNDSFLRLTGYSREEVIGHGSIELGIWAKPGSRARMLEMMRDQGKIHGSEYEFRMKSGEVRLGLLSVETISVGGQECFLNTMTDITQRKQAEEYLKESEGRFRRVSAITSDIAYSCRTGEDGRFSIEWMTGAAERITGYSCEEIKAQGCWRFLVVEEDQSLFAENVIGLAPGFYGICALRISHKNGGIVWVASSAECIQEPSTPGLLLLYGGLRDITGNKLAEEKLTESARKIVARNEELRSALANQDALLKEVRHRVKNNLMVISSLLNLQMRQTTDQEARESLRESYARVMSMAMIHEQVLQSGEYAAIDFTSYINDLVSNIRSSLAPYKKDVGLTVDVQPGIIIGLNQAVTLGMIINEIASNSFKHAFEDCEKPEISISCRHLEDQVQVSIKDNGVGIRDELDMDNPSSLGIQLVNTLVKQLDGTIKYERDNGSKFTIMFNTKPESTAEVK